MPLRPTLVALAACGAIAATACANSGRELRSPQVSRPAAIMSTRPTAFSFASPALDAGGQFARRYLADAAAPSPPLSWSGLPPGTRVLAIVARLFDVVDQGATGQIVWVVANIDPATAGVGEGQVPAGAIVVSSTSARPPTAQLTLQLRLFALARPLVTTGLDAAGYARSFEGENLAFAELTGKLPAGPG